ncbi:marine proteobacterial sortase target protein [Haliea sp.]|uniref:marine proteobacterial sortase target protein n=1 Tax=Haliea sp. TaxID=1932666 RepID=UPI0035294144
MAMHLLNRGGTAGVLLRVCFRILPQWLAAVLCLLVLSAGTVRADIDETPGSGQLLLQRPGLPPVPALLQHSRFDVQVAGMVAVVRLQQTFENTSADWVEGVYVFPLPGNAAVRAMEMRAGDRRIVGRVRERQEAQTLYRQAASSGRKASLVSQQRPNLFQNRIANVAPGETVTVVLEFVQPVEFADSVFSLRLPMTLTPRYIPGVSLPRDGGEPAAPDYLAWHPATDQVPDAPLITAWQHTVEGSDALPLNPVSIAVELNAGLPLARVDTPSHAMRLSRAGNRYELQLARGPSEMDRDFVLRWTPATGSEPRAALFTEAIDGDHYGMLLVVPPGLQQATGAPPRELVFVVDTSGSMGGVPLQQARQSLAAALDGLRPSDHFNIIAFDHGYRSLFQEARAASADALQRARRFVGRLEAGGGTEMLPPLRHALGQGRDSNGERLRQIVFLTDGAVGNEQAIIDMIASQLGASRLFTVGIGSAPNSWFLRKAAELGRGRHLHVGELSEISAQMDALVGYLAAPLLTDVQVHWPQAVADAGGPVPDLYAGAPLVRSVRFNTPPQGGVIRVTGTLAGQPWEQALMLDGQAQSAAPGVGSLWARARIQTLLDERFTGTREEVIRANVLAVALQHQLLSPYTSFIAVEEHAQRPADVPLKPDAVRNTRPRGQDPQGFAYPQTATTAAAKLFIACLLLFFALLVWVMRGPELDHVPDDAAQ